MQRTFPQRLARVDEVGYDTWQSTYDPVVRVPLRVSVARSAYARN